MYRSVRSYQAQVRNFRTNKFRTLNFVKIIFLWYLKTLTESGSEEKLRIRIHNTGGFKGVGRYCLTSIVAVMQRTRDFSFLEGQNLGFCIGCYLCRLLPLKKSESSMTRGHVCSSNCTVFYCISLRVWGGSCKEYEHVPKLTGSMQQAVGVSATRLLFL